MMKPTKETHTEYKEAAFLFPRKERKALSYELRTTAKGFKSSLLIYSHSIVPTGFGVRSNRTLLTPSTSWVIRSVMC